MGLNIGMKVGPYQIVAPLGAGGMGEVFRARDTRLDREVAIKVLPTEFSQDLSRRQRFAREAKTISGLNHANICTLYDVGSQDGIEYLVMELVEGESLFNRLQRGPLPLSEVLLYGAQIAAGLDRAHRSGVVHRDLKPANIMLTGTGAKLLDFGLARPVGLAASALASNSLATMSTPAQQSPVTQEGTIVGTFQYMSPEQIEGREVDARSDIFSLGAVLYEMVTARRAFEGKSQLSVVSAILEKDPEPVTVARPGTPPMLDRIIRRCLAKQPEQRWQSACDLAAQLSWVSDASSSTVAAPTAPVSRYLSRRYLLGSVIALVVVVAVAIFGWRIGHNAPASRVARLSINLPQGDVLGGAWWWYESVAISPDGSQIAYVARRSGHPQIFLRTLADSSVRPLDGTEGAETPFFSPDGNWLGFSKRGKLEKLPLSGGPNVEVTSHAGADPSWSSDGFIYFTLESDGVYRVSAEGGEPQNVMKIDATKGEMEARMPEPLPSGNILAVVRRGDQPSFDDADIVGVTGRNGEKKILIKGGSDPHYSPSGHLLFIRAGVLMAVPFDATKLELKGSPVPIEENILENPRIGAGQYAISRDGTLVFIAGGVTYGEHELVFADKTGTLRTLTAKTRPYEDFTVSPDGRFIATTIEGAVTDTWIHDVERDTETRFTFGVENRDPTWTPDGKRVAYSGFRDGHYRIWWKPLDGSVPEETLVTADNPVDAWFFTPDANGLLYTDYRGGLNARNGIGYLALHDRKTHNLFPLEFAVEWAKLSPDGKWMAFNSQESGRTEVYVAPFPALAPRERISTDGGYHPQWSPDGRELYYRARASGSTFGRELGTSTRIMAVSMAYSPSLKAGQPRQLFEGPFFQSGHDWAVTPDGKGFIFIRERNSESGPTELRVVLNWTEDLIRRSSTK